MMSEVLRIVNNKRDKETVITYFRADSDRYKYLAFKKQGKMLVVGYSVLDISSPIIGYSLFFHGVNGFLLFIDAAVDPLNDEAIKNTTELITKAFDSDPVGSESRLHFLGNYDLNEKTIIKIMIRERSTNVNPVYSIRYIISSK